MHYSLKDVGGNTKRDSMTRDLWPQIGQYDMEAEEKKQGGVLVGF
jgi:hypothetical protein